MLFAPLAIWLNLAWAQAQYKDPNTAEGWAWPQIERSEMADFNERCHTSALDPRNEKDTRWRDDCRKLSARFLQDLLTRPPWREAVPFAGIQIKGARVVGDFDLENAKLIRSISILSSRFEGAINLVHARSDGLIWLEDSLMTGRFDADGLHSESNLFLRRNIFKNDIILKGAKIDGQVELTGTRFDGKLLAGQLHVGGYLLMNSDNQSNVTFNDVDLIDAKVTGQLNLLGATLNGPMRADLLKVGGNLFAPSVGGYKTKFQGVSLIGAEIAGQLSLIGTSVEGDLSAGLLQVGGNLMMNSDPKNKASFKSVDLTGARIAGNVGMGGASFDGVLAAGFLQVGGTLSMASQPPNITSFKKSMNLNGAKITGAFHVDGASFEREISADSLKVGGDLSMRYACYAEKAVLVFANIGGNLDLRGASFADLDFSGALVSGELRLDGQKLPNCSKPSVIPDVLNLRNSKVGNLLVADDESMMSRRLRLDGFAFGRMGGVEGGANAQLQQRSAKWWDQWVRSDPDYSPTPYAQLAAAFINAGDREAADDVRYLDREREREVACKASWLGGSCVLQTALGLVAGYGIGSHTFVVLYWVLAFWLTGVALLWWTVPAAKDKGAIWCFCASLAQLLPVITISKELTAFFDDPDRTRLKGWQVFVFSALGVMGLALGTLLLIAVSGLTRGS